MAASSMIERFSSLLHDAWQASPRRVVGWAGFGLAVLLFLAHLPFFLKPGFSVFATEMLYSLYVMAWLWLLTAGSRTVSLSTVVVFWFAGVYPVMFLALLLGLPIAELFGVQGHFVGDLWVPVTEEFAKASPLVLYFVLAGRVKGFQPSATDGLLLGYAVGAGMGFHEDMMWGRVWGSGWSAAPPWSVLFPTVEFANGGSLFRLYHAEWTALVGLALGMAFLFKAQRRRVWLLPLGGYALVVLEHIATLFTSSAGREGPPFLIEAIHTLLLQGKLIILLLLMGVAVTLFLERRLLRSVAGRSYPFPGFSLRAVFSNALLPVLRKPTGVGLLRLHAVLRYVRLRRAALYALWKDEEERLGDEASRVLFSAMIRAGFTPARPNREANQEM